MLIALVTSLLLGVTLTAIGLRGRRTDDHPLCRRCRFDLTGRAVDSTRCPECGGDLDTPRAIRVGHRRRRTGVLGSGLVLVVLSLSSAGVVGYGRARHVNWLAHAPLWYVLPRAASADAGRRTPALAAVAAKADGGRLSPADWGRVADVGLAYQADLAKPWDPAWGDLIEAGHTEGVVVGERWGRYARQGVVPTSVVAVVRPRVRAGDPIVWTLNQPTMRLARRSAVSVCWDSLDLAIGTGGPPVDFLHSFDYDYHGQSDDGRVRELNTAVPPGMPPGRQPLRLTGAFRLYSPCDAGHYWDHGTVPFATPAAMFDLLPADQPSVTLHPAPELDAAVRRFFACRVERWSPGDDDADTNVEFVNSDPAPANLVVAVWVRAGGRETRVVNGRYWRKGETVHKYILPELFFKLDPPGASSIDLVIRPDPQLAARTVDVTDIWQGEVVLKDLPVERP